VIIPPNTAAVYVFYACAVPGMSGYEDPTIVSPNGLTYFGVSFFVTPLDALQQPIRGLQVTTPVIMSVTSNTLKTSALLYYFNTLDGNWEDTSATCTGLDFFLSNSGGTMVLNVCHFTQYAVYQAGSSTASASTGASAASTTHKTSTATGIIAPAVTFILAPLAYLLL